MVWTSSRSSEHSCSNSLNASAIYSSAHDLLRFGMFHLKNHLDEQRAILKDETIDLMQNAMESTTPLKLKVLDRRQLRMMTLDVDSLIGLDHKARAIWDLSGTIDLTAFYGDIRSQVGGPGREHNDPRLLISLHVKR